MTGEVSQVHLVEVDSGDPVPAELWDAITDNHIQDWKDEWMPVVLDRLNQMAKAGVTSEHWPQSWHWNWGAKMDRISGLLAFSTFAIVCQNKTQGLMQLSLAESSRIETQKGKPLVFIEYLEAAPWNRGEMVPNPLFRGVGVLLVRAAIEFSINEEFQGRIGLHSLPQSNNFYGSKCGMTDLGKDLAKEMNYFEMTPEQAQSFLQKG